MFSILFGHNELSINIDISIPVIELYDEIRVDPGRITVHRLEKKKYQALITEPQSIWVKGKEVIHFKEGNEVNFISSKPQTI